MPDFEGKIAVFAFEVVQYLRGSGAVPEIKYISFVVIGPADCKIVLLSGKILGCVGILIGLFFLHPAVRRMDAFPSGKKEQEGQ